MAGLGGQTHGVHKQGRNHRGEISYEVLSVDVSQTMASIYVIDASG